jgi:hypothetical protein
LLCRLGACEQGVPVKLPEAASLPRRR